MQLMLPIMLPDMTLYSVVTLAQRLNGSSRGEQVSQSLFGARSAGLRHDFSSHLAEFCRRTGSAYGSADEVALNTTVLPYFLRFRRPEVQAAALSLMRGNSIERLKFILGLPAGPSGASLPLRSCKKCSQNDVDIHGVAYWHRQHQVPGVYVCPNDGSPLHITSRRIDGVGRSMLFLPDDQDICFSNTTTYSGLAHPILNRLAILGAALLEHQLPGGYSPELLQYAYLHGLKQHGLLTKGGRVRATEFVKWLQDKYQSIARLEPYDQIIGKNHVEGMLRLVRKPRGNFHSTCHLLLIDALFGSWELFESVYGWERQMELPLSSHQIDNDPCLPNQNELLVIELAKRYQEGQGSLTSLSRDLGVDVNTAMRWLGKLGLISIRRRPHVLTSELRTEVIQSIRKGIALREIAKSFSLSRSTIDRICNEHPQLHSAWCIANLERKRQAERNKLSAYIASNPSLSILKLRQAPDSGYNWLSRNDSEWLKLSISQPKLKSTRPSSPRRSRVDWSARDNECLTALKELGKSLRFEDSERIQPMVVMRKLPKLSFSPRLEQLPKSRAWVADQLNQARIDRMTGN